MSNISGTNEPVRISDSSGNPLTSTAGALNVSSSGGGGGVVTQGTNPWIVQDVAAEASLATIAAAPPPSASSIGTAVAGALANPLPVSLPAATVTTLTPPSAAAIGAAVPVPPSAAAIAAALANPLPVSLAVAPSTPVTGTVGVNNFPATQPVSGTVAVSNPDVNYSLESGGNLGTIASQTANTPQIVDLLLRVIACLNAINITLGNTQGVYINPDDTMSMIQ